MPDKTMTVGEFRQWVEETLSLYPDDAELVFGDQDLSLKRAKSRGIGPNGETTQVQIEFNEIYKVVEAH